MMSSQWYQMSLLVVATAAVMWCQGACASCPINCSCELDIRGRNQVLCNRGGMVGTIPVRSMDKDTEVLMITAPSDNSNDLTIGPIFTDFNRLEEIHIVESNIPAIGRHSFWGVITLRVLNLTQNNISQAHDYNFRGLGNLLELHLDDNNIESIPSGAFRHLQELRVLTLARNKITELAPRLFLKLSKLQYLDLSGNEIGELNPEMFKDVQELRTFKCQGCGLSNLNTLIYKLLPDLEILDLRDNQFKYIASDEFKDLKHLQYLHLDGNQLPVILDRTFSGHNLHALTISRNRIAKVTALAFANFTVKHLDLSYNKLDRLETETFTPLADSLRRLNLGGNSLPIGDVKYVLHGLLKLRELELPDMNLAELPLGIFVFHEHLRFLNLSSNLFTHFPAQILSPLPRLHELDLSNNIFRGLDERLLAKFDQMSNLKIIHLEGNPWSCDLCHIIPMLKWLNRSSLFKKSCERPLSSSCLRCTTPYLLNGRRLMTLNPGHLGWCGEESAAPNILPDDSQLGIIVACAIAVLLLITVIIIAIIYNRHAAHYYTHEEDRAEQEAIFENPAVLDENGDLRFKDRKEKKKVSIATIDEITKDPELNHTTVKVNGQQTLTNGT